MASADADDSRDQVDNGSSTWFGQALGALVRRAAEKPKRARTLTHGR